MAAAERDGESLEFELHRIISRLMREFRLEPGMLASSPYADLHANDISLFELLTEPRVWTVRGIAQALHAPITTISSALDRLERRGLICRTRTDKDRRVVRVELTARGNRLEMRLRDAHVLNCEVMLSRLAREEQEEFLKLAAKIAKPAVDASNTLGSAIGQSPHSTKVQPKVSGSRMLP